MRLNSGVLTVTLWRPYLFVMVIKSNAFNAHVCSMPRSAQQSQDHGIYLNPLPTWRTSRLPLPPPFSHQETGTETGAYPAHALKWKGKLKLREDWVRMGEIHFLFSGCSGWNTCLVSFQLNRQCPVPALSPSCYTVFLQPPSSFGGSSAPHSGERLSLCFSPNPNPNPCARIELTASLAAGTVPCVHTQCENNVDNSDDDVVVAEQRLPQAKDVPVSLAVLVRRRRSTRSWGRAWPGHELVGKWWPCGFPHRPSMAAAASGFATKVPVRGSAIPAPNHCFSRCLNSLGSPLGFWELEQLTHVILIHFLLQDDTEKCVFLVPSDTEEEFCHPAGRF